jgi:Zn finger protein HypA/HybF involved in hydrogenase expression
MVKSGWNVRNQTHKIHKECGQWVVKCGQTNKNYLLEHNKTLCPYCKYIHK